MNDAHLSWRGYRASELLPGKDQPGSRQMRMPRGAERVSSEPMQLKQALL